MWAITTYQKGYNPITPLIRVIQLHPQLPFYRGPITPLGAHFVEILDTLFLQTSHWVGRCFGRMKPCGEGTDASMEVN